jgi:hypothetical protein
MSGRWLLIAVVLCNAVISLPAAATQISADSLMRDCRAEADTSTDVPVIRCRAYLRGFLDAVNAVEPVSAQTLSTPFGSRVARLPPCTTTFCLPENIALADLIELLHEENTSPGAQELAPDLLLDVLAQRYPCSREK